MGNYISKKVTSTQLPVINLSAEKEIKIIIQHWIRILNIQLGWIHEFDKLVINYAKTLFIFDTFRSSSKLLKTFGGYTMCVNSIDYSTFDGSQFICSASNDNTVCVWNVDTKKQIRSFSEHSDCVNCVKFSQYHYHNHRLNVVCSSSWDKTIRFWDIKNNQQLQLFDQHIYGVYCIEFSPFNGGRYLCSGSIDTAIRLWDVETSKALHVFYGHASSVRCVDISPVQNNNKNDNKSNNIGVIGGNGYTICSGSWDNTIRIWDIETTKQLNLLNGHEKTVNSVKYESSKSKNTILSGSDDKSVRLWDIRSGQQIQMFNGHTSNVYAVEYSPFVVNNIEAGIYSNVICSGSAIKQFAFGIFDQIRMNCM
ncbi:WD-40 repeat-containing protein [Reticulomyxa filosa]|uniref:WD-40 repeat-containing protein n=1 Tax=Reticulomyxa filosa TaxID=46433 RepID=X6N7X9_RETFI|nr:WD-40 repeat-containing protein [Reticulomyxa filosa]|eukprot:ETO21859.1 WD-40 repeat-containing protein [Reticulomyxa filosa]